jgi:hypothetical protein
MMSHLLGSQFFEFGAHWNQKRALAPQLVEFGVHWKQKRVLAPQLAQFHGSGVEY